MTSSFTYEIQEAGYPFDKSDHMGDIGPEGFVEAFRSFPWSQHAGRAQGGAEATISVNNINDGTTLFVSVMGDPLQYAHIIGIVFEKARPGWLGMFSRPPVRWVDLYVTDDPRLVESVFATFFSSSLSETVEQLERLDKYDSQPAATNAS